jgi:hypothetical protein
MGEAAGAPGRTGHSSRRYASLTKISAAKTAAREDVVEPRDQWATARRVVEGYAGHEHTIEEALQDRRYIKPPLRKDENELFCQHEPRDIAGDGLAIIGRREITATLGAGKARIEFVSIKINHVDLDTSMLERRADACGGGLGESVVERMGDDQKHTQGRTLPILPCLSA